MCGLTSGGGGLFPNLPFTWLDHHRIIQLMLPSLSSLRVCSLSKSSLMTSIPNADTMLVCLSYCGEDNNARVLLTWFLSLMSSAIFVGGAGGWTPCSSLFVLFLRRSTLVILVRPSPVVSGSMSTWSPPVAVLLSFSSIFFPGEASSSSASCSLTACIKRTIVFGGSLVCCCVFTAAVSLS